MYERQTRSSIALAESRRIRPQNNGLLAQSSPIKLAIKDLRGLLSIRSDELAKIRSVSLRRGVWFKVLNRLERGLMNLALKVTRRVRSRVLADALYSIVEKLLNALESKISQQMRQIGIPLADKLSRIAQKWGNRLAHKWAKDLGFIKYLTVMKMNG